MVYFSIAALPIFGFGQFVLARLDRSGTGLILVITYLSCAIGLLLLTSFLGLRRYLRQRRLKMPGSIARKWITTGALITVGVLLVSLMLPRPVVSNAGGSQTSMLQGKTLENDRSIDGADEGQSEEEGESTGDNAEDDGTAHGEASDEEPGESESDQESTENSNESTSGVSNIFSSAILRWIVWGILRDCGPDFRMETPGRNHRRSS